MKKYISHTEEVSVVSEPTVTADGYAYTEKSCINHSSCNEDFQTMWQRSLSVEDFRQKCISKLRGIYGKDN